MKVLQDLPAISNWNGRSTSDESTMSTLDSSQPPLALTMICATTSSNCITLLSFSNAGARNSSPRDQSAAPPGDASAAAAADPGPAALPEKGAAASSSSNESEQPHFAMDFNQGSDSTRAKTVEAAAADTSSQLLFESPAGGGGGGGRGGGEGAAAAAAAAAGTPPQLQFESPAGNFGALSSAATTTRDDGESSEATQPPMKRAGPAVAAPAESSEEEDAGNGASGEQEEDEDEIQTELEGESHQMPEPQYVPRILTHPAGQKKQRQDIVFGKLSVMVSEVSEDAMVLQLRSKALSDLLERQHTYRAIALRCGCELILTRRVVVKRMVKWMRYAVLLLRGPSDAALKRFRAQLEAANVAFRLAVPYDAGRPRPRLLTSEQLPDNLPLAVCAERTGRAVVAWERLPLEMPQRRQGKPLYGSPKNLILPNNAAIGQALGHLYPAWGFQGSKPIPHTHTFEAAVAKAQELENQQEAELRQKTAGNKD